MDRKLINRAARVLDLQVKRDLAKRRYDAHNRELADAIEDLINTAETTDGFRGDIELNGGIVTVSDGAGRLLPDKGAELKHAVELAYKERGTEFVQIKLNPRKKEIKEALAGVDAKTRKLLQKAGFQIVSEPSVSVKILIGDE